MKDKYYFEDIHEEYAIALDKDNEINPYNALAEYCFGRMCDKHFFEIKKIHSHIDLDSLEKSFRLAISFGLTYEMSTSKVITKEFEDIWNKVEEQERKAENENNS